MSDHESAGTGPEPAGEAGGLQESPGANFYRSLATGPGNEASPGGYVNKNVAFVDGVQTEITYTNPETGAAVPESVSPQIWDKDITHDYVEGVVVQDSEVDRASNVIRDPLGSGDVVGGRDLTAPGAVERARAVIERTRSEPVGASSAELVPRPRAESLVDQISAGQAPAGPEPANRVPGRIAADMIRPSVPEVQKNSEQAEQIRDTVDAVYQYGLSLGVDLSGRLPSPDAIRLLDHDSFNRAREAQMQQGAGDSKGEMLVEVNPDNPAETFMRLQHEIIANVCNQARDPAAPTTEATAAFAGVTAELMNIEIARTQWAQYSKLAALSGEPYHAYAPEAMVVEDVIGKAAERYNMSFKDMLRHVESGLLTGRVETLGVISEGLGPENVRQFVQLSAEVGGREVAPWRQFSEAAGLNGASAKLDRWVTAGQEVRVLDALD